MKAVMRAGTDGPSVELALFTLQPDGSVAASYADDEQREAFEDGEYVCTSDGELTPSDGQVFFDALERAFASSSYLYVEQR